MEAINKLIQAEICLVDFVTTVTASLGSKEFIQVKSATRSARPDQAEL